MYLWQIEYNYVQLHQTYVLVVNRFKLCIFDRLNTTIRINKFVIAWLWIALNYVSLTDWIQLLVDRNKISIVVNRFKLCIFDRLNTTATPEKSCFNWLWIALNYVSLTDWIQLACKCKSLSYRLWIALNYVSLTDWIQHVLRDIIIERSCESL